MATQGCFLLLCLAFGVTLGQNRNCFNTACGNGDSLSACAAGHWQCHLGEVCLMNVKHDATVSMICDQANHAHCNQANHNDASCALLVYPPQHDCLYCCGTEQCVRNIEARVVLATTTTPTTTTTTPTPTTTIGHNLHAGSGRASCFTSDCYHVDLAQCISGQWACTAHQYCHVQGQPDGTLHMNCDDIAHYVACLYHISQNAPECRVSIQGHCQYCCNDADCVRRLASVPATHPPATTTTKSTPAPTLATPAPTPAPTTATPAPTPAPTTSTPAPTPAPTTAQPTQTAATAPPTTATNPCYDHFAGDCSVTFAGQCHNPEVANVCQKTCGVCYSTTTPPTTTTTTPSPTTTPTPTTTTSTTTTPAATTVCEDHYAGDCSVDFAGRCGEETIGHFLCPKFCGTCNPLPCRDLFTGDCSVTFAGRCNEPAILEICRQTCGCAGPMTTTTVVPTTTTAPMTTTKVVVPTTTTDGCIDKFHGDCSVALNGLCSYEVVADLCQKTCNTCGSGSNSATTTSSNSGHLIG